jgi:hypothetical protein
MATKHAFLSLSNKKARCRVNTWPFEKAERIDRLLQAQRIRGPFQGRLMTINPGFHPKARHSNLNLEFSDNQCLDAAKG